MNKGGHFQSNGCGPWRIINECPAVRHNTLYAARGRNTEPCVCPHALELFEQERVRRSKYSKNLRKSRPPASNSGKPRVPAWFKAGPWRIVDECLSEGHNTQNWARGAARGSDKRIRCVCPHALALLADYRKYAKKTDKAYRERTGSRKMPNPVIAVSGVSIAPKSSDPDWLKGACLENSKVVDLGFDITVSAEGVKNRAIAKMLCDICPIKRECGDWAVKTEGNNPGSLGGVYGGMDAWNRKGLDLRLNDAGKVVRVRWKRPTIG